MEYYIDPASWTADKKSSQQSRLTNLYDLPSAIITLDKAVCQHIVNMSTSQDFFSQLKRMDRAIGRSSRGWKLSIRATYLNYWVRNLVWCIPQAKGAEIILARAPWRQQCHHCQSTSGYKVPQKNVKGIWLNKGDVLSPTEIPRNIRDAEKAVIIKILSMRAKGCFDELLIMISKTLAKLKGGLLDYLIKLHILHYLNGKEIAVSSGPWITPGIKAEFFSRAKGSSITYYIPCEYCGGQGFIW